MYNVFDWEIKSCGAPIRSTCSSFGIMENDQLFFSVVLNVKKLCEICNVTNVKVLNYRSF